MILINVFIVYNIVIDIGSGQQILQPMDITRMEGADNVIIPCPIYTGLPPIWTISGNYYDFKSLPKEYKPAFIEIIIPTIYRDMNGTTFQYFYSTGDGLEIE